MADKMTVEEARAHLARCGLSVRGFAKLFEIPVDGFRKCFRVGTRRRFSPSTMQALRDMTPERVAELKKEKAK